MVQHNFTNIHVLTAFLIKYTHILTALLIKCIYTNCFSQKNTHHHPHTILNGIHVHILTDAPLCFQGYRQTLHEKRGYTYAGGHSQNQASYNQNSYSYSSNDFPNLNANQDSRHP